MSSLKAYLAIAAGAGMLHAGCGAVDPCGNMILGRVGSPSGQHAAVVFERDCGATTGFSTHVSVLEAGEAFREQPSFVQSTCAGNTLRIDTDHGAAPSGPGGGPAVVVKWDDDQQMMLA